MSIENQAQQLENLKLEFFQNYEGRSHIQEILPSNSTETFQINSDDLEHLHRFAKSNPIYNNWYEEKILGIDCIVYEGDINQYWIDSLKHATSGQPFYPTWIISAYLVVSLAKNLGYKEIIDVGSGDGRIAFCGKILGMRSVGIELDNNLVQLQKRLCKSNNLFFEINCADATTFDYFSLNLSAPAVFTGGLPQLGDLLALEIIQKFHSNTLGKNSCFVLAGSQSKKQFSKDTLYGGWDDLISKFDLSILKIIYLPTVWTFDQQKNTPYIFTTLK